MGKAMPGAIQADVRRRTVKADRGVRLDELRAGLLRAQIESENARADELENEDKSLQDDIKDQDDRSSALLEETTQLGRQLKAEKARCAALEADKAELQRKVEKLGLEVKTQLDDDDQAQLLETALSELEASADAYKSVEAELKAAQAQIETSTKDLEKATKERKDLQAELEAAEKRLKTEQKKANDPQANGIPAFANPRSSSGKTQQQLEELLAQRNKAIDISTARGNRLEELVNRLRDERDMIEKSLRTKTEEASKLAAKVPELDGKIVQLKTELEAVETRARTQINAARDQAEKLKDEAEKLQQEVLAEQDRVSASESDRLEKEQSIAVELEEKLAKLQAEKEAKDVELASLKARVAAANGKPAAPLSADSALASLQLDYVFPPWSEHAKAANDGKIKAVFNALKALHRRAEESGIRLSLNLEEPIIVVTGRPNVLDGVVAKGDAPEERRFALPLGVVQSIVVALCDGIDAALSLTEKLRLADETRSELEQRSNGPRDADDDDLQNQLEHERRKVKAFGDRVVQLNQQIAALKSQITNKDGDSSTVSGGESNADQASRLRTAEETASRLRAKVVKLNEQLAAARDENVALLSVIGE